MACEHFRWDMLESAITLISEFDSVGWFPRLEVLKQRQNLYPLDSKQNFSYSRITLISVWEFGLKYINYLEPVYIYVQ